MEERVVDDAGEGEGGVREPSVAAGGAGEEVVKSLLVGGL